MLKPVELVSDSTMCGSHQQQCGRIETITPTRLHHVIKAEMKASSEFRIVHKITVNLDEDVLIRAQDPFVFEVIGVLSVIDDLEFETMLFQNVPNSRTGVFRNKQIHIGIGAECWARIKPIRKGLSLHDHERQLARFKGFLHGPAMVCEQHLNAETFD